MLFFLLLCFFFIYLLLLFRLHPLTTLSPSSYFSPLSSSSFFLVLVFTLFLTLFFFFLLIPYLHNFLRHLNIFLLLLRLLCLPLSSSPSSSFTLCLQFYNNRSAYTLYFHLRKNKWKPATITSKKAGSTRSSKTWDTEGKLPLSIFISEWFLGFESDTSLNNHAYAYIYTHTI